MIFAPPRHTKSELASRRFPAWYLGRHPDRQIICCAYGEGLATDFGRDVRKIVSSEEYRDIFDVALRQDSRAAERWQTGAGGVYVAASVGGGITGRGAHLLLIDDPLKGREAASSATIRERIWQWYVNDAYSRLMPGGAIVIIMTRWHDDDLAGRLLEAQDDGGDRWTVLSLPALARESDPLGRAPGDPLWPEWFPLPALERTRAAITSRDGPSAWSALYQQEPVAESGEFFLRPWMQFYRRDDLPRALRYHAASDYAVTASGGDYTAHVVVGIDHLDDIYVVDLYREQADSAAWVEAAIDLMARWKPLSWAEERGQIEKGVGPFLEKRMRERRVYCTRKQFTSSSDKATRAQSIRGRMSMKKVFFPIEAAWCDDLVGELLRFPAGAFDDQVDALSLIGRMLSEMRGGVAPPPPPKKLDDFRDPNPPPRRNPYGPLRLVRAKDWRKA